MAIEASWLHPAIVPVAMDEVVPVRPPVVVAHEVAAKAADAPRAIHRPHHRAAIHGAVVRIVARIEPAMIEARSEHHVPAVEPAVEVAKATAVKVAEAA